MVNRATQHIEGAGVMYLLDAIKEALDVYILNSEGLVSEEYNTKLTSLYNAINELQIQYIKEFEPEIIKLMEFCGE